MNWVGKRVLVTGAGGFIGSHLAEKLVEHGAKVRAFVHYNALGSYGWLDQSLLRDEMEILQGDICDGDSTDKTIDKIDYVFHLAALIAIPYSYQAPESYIRTNIVGTLNILRSVRRKGVERLIHTSTSEVYGSARAIPITEDHPLQAQSPYAASKIAADKLCESFFFSFDAPVVIVRPFNTFGPRQSSRAIIPTIISQSLTKESILLGNLHPTRDLNYVTNTVDGFMRAAATPDILGQVFNLGSGKEISIGDLARKIIKLVKKPVNIITEEKRIRPPGSEVDRLIADSSKATTVLEWKPEVNMEEGLKLTISWIKKNRSRFRPDVYSV